MAEVFGVVASALAVAELTGKFGVSLFKLKQLWNEVQDVPENINRTLRQLELVRPVIAELEAVLAEQADAVYQGSAAYSSIQACNQVVDEMEALAVDLQSQIATAKRSRRSITKLRVSFKRETIQNHQERLRFILDLVSISQMTCMMAVVRSQASNRLLQHTETDEPESSTAMTKYGMEDSVRADLDGHCGPIDRRRRKSMPRPSQKTSIFGVLEYHTEPHPKHPGIEIRTSRLKLPGWITETIWDFQAYRAYNGWKVSLRPWNTRPSDTPIFTYAENGMLREMLEAFRDNLASPWDRDEDGETLLHHASYYGHFETIKYLLNMGLTLRETRNDGITSLGYMWTMSEDLGEVMQLYRLLLCNDDFDERFQQLFIPLTSKDTLNQSSRYLGLFGIMWRFAEFREMILDKVGVTYYELPLEARFASFAWYCVKPEVLLEDLRSGQGVHPMAFRGILGRKLGVNSSLSVFAFQYAIATPSGKRYSWPGRKENFERWRDLARWLFTDISLEELTKEDENTFWGEELTPFMTAIAWGSRFLSSSRPAIIAEKRDNKRQLLRFLSSWLEDVQSAGIDLVEYGKRELELYICHDRIRASRWCSLDICPHTKQYPLSGPRLVSFTYGPRPEDWELMWDPDTEEFAGDFWELVEDRPLSVPGAWEEDW